MFSFQAGYRLLRYPAWKRSGIILVEWEGMEKQKIKECNRRPGEK